MGNCILTKGGMSGGVKLLWTNPNPTSSFGAQTVALDLSKYIFVYILLVPEGSDTGYVGQLCKIGETQILISSLVNNSSAFCRVRKVTITTTGLKFQTGYAGTSGSGDLCKPYKIYGLK